MATIKEEPGTVTISDRTEGEEKIVNLKRLEVDKSERQLGVILPLNGNCKQEFNRRVQMSKTLGDRVYIAPLSVYESIMVYRLYYIPKVNYPLSMTRFTVAESETIQRQFYSKALPKMGLNCHMPHAVVFGPTQYGGLELHHIYSQQLIQHITSIIKHI